MIYFISGLVLGIVISNVYQSWKYRLPENQELLKLKQAKLRAERLSYELDEEKSRLLIDDMLEERMR